MGSCHRLLLWTQVPLLFPVAAGDGHVDPRRHLVSVLFMAACYVCWPYDMGRILRSERRQHCNVRVSFSVDRPFDLNGPFDLDGPFD